MQNKYFGDIHDFFKFYFLKNISINHKLGINWYLVPDDGSNDGKKIVMKRPKLIEVDETLYKILENSILTDNRNILNIQKMYFNINTKYFNDIYEEYYLEGVYEGKALNCLNSQNLIFFDPDTGLEVESTKTKERYKYVSYRMLSEWWKQGKSLIIFQYKDFNKYSCKDKCSKIVTALNCSYNNIIIVKIEDIFYYCIINDNHKTLYDSINNFCINNKNIGYEIITSAHFA